MQLGAACRRSKAALAGVVLAACSLAAVPGRCLCPEQARLFVEYMRATGRSEDPMTWMERIAVSYLMAGQKAQKAKEARARPASLNHSS